MKFSAFRRIVAPLLCLILVLQLAPTVLAESDPEGAREVILQAYEELGSIEGLELTVDLKEYGLSVDELMAIIDETGLYDQCLVPWYLDSYTYFYYETSGVIRSLTLVRKDPKVYDYDLMEQRIAEALAASVKEGMSQWQIVLAIHDYLIANCVYDETYVYRGFYDVMVRGTAVCSGYAEAFIYLLQKVGIQCRYVYSEGMDHAWNQVYLDGNWYHMDGTWDDPTSDAQGRVLHRFFLISDEAMADEEHEHYDWQAAFECTDTSLDADRFWLGVESQICFESADVFYFREKNGDTSFAIYRRDREGNETVVTTCQTGFTDIGAGDGHRYYYYSHGLDLVDGKLYYSDMKGVYAINTDGTGQETVYSHDCFANKSYILGSHVVGDKIRVTVADREGNQTVMELSLPYETHTHSYTAQVTEPSCGQAGYTQYSCQCGISYQGQKTAPLEHSYDEGTVVQEAALGQPGTKRFTCTHCGHTKTEEYSLLPDNNPLTDADGVTEEEYTFRRILLGAGVVLLALLFRRKKR